MCCGLTAGVRLAEGAVRDTVDLGLANTATVEGGLGLPRIAGVGWARDRDAVAGVLAAGAGWGTGSVGGAPSAGVVSGAGVGSAADVSVVVGPEMGGIDTGGMDGVSVGFGGVTGFGAVGEIFLRSVADGRERTLLGDAGTDGEPWVLCLLGWALSDSRLDWFSNRASRLATDARGRSSGRGMSQTRKVKVRVQSLGGDDRRLGFMSFQ